MLELCVRSHPFLFPAGSVFLQLQASHAAAGSQAMQHATQPCPPPIGQSGFCNAKASTLVHLLWRLVVPDSVSTGMMTSWDNMCFLHADVALGGSLRMRKTLKKAAEAAEEDKAASGKPGKRRLNKHVKMEGKAAGPPCNSGKCKTNNVLAAAKRCGVAPGAPPASPKLPSAHVFQSAAAAAAGEGAALGRSARSSLSGRIGRIGRRRQGPEGQPQHLVFFF